MTTANESPAGRAAEVGSRDTIVIECDLPDPPEKVWRALTVPELLAVWLMPNDIRPVVGERFRFEAQESKPATDGDPRDSDPGDRNTVRSAGRSIDCEVLEVGPNRVLRYRWTTRESEPDRVLDSVVSFELTRSGDGGTHLRVVHGEFQFRVMNVIRLPARNATTRKPRMAMARRPAVVGIWCATDGGLRWAA